MKSKRAEASAFETYKKGSSGGERPRAGPGPIETVDLRSLRLARRNARTHSKKQIRQIADSMLRFGVINPLIVDDQGRVVAGHGRFAAAELLGLRQLPVIRLSHLTDEEIRAYMLADNRLAEKAGWDRELLAIEFEELQIALPEVGLDLGITGFDPGEVDSIMLDFSDDGANSADQIPDADGGPAVARKGDLFILGPHRILAGDARDERSYVTLMHGEVAEMAFLDPPYNVKVAGHVGGRGRIKHGEFACASGEMTPEEFVRFLKETLGACARHTVNGGITYVCMDWRHARELLEAGSAVYDELKNICVWAKTTPGQGSFYRSQHEFVFVFKRGASPHLNTFELGQDGRTRSNVWTYPGANAFRAGRMDELRMHPTVKPVALVADAMRDCSRRGSIVLDAFAGSGASIMAAERIGRRTFCIEIEPRYVDVAIRRWQQYTGKDAILESTGQTFEELATIGPARERHKPAVARAPQRRSRRAGR